MQPLRCPARVGVTLASALLLGGCGVRDCALDINHGDCLAQGSPNAFYPEDDLTCRSYGLTPGTRDYATCRSGKAHVRTLTSRETDYGFLPNPLTPGVRY